MFKKIILLCAFGFITSIKAQVISGTPCETPDSHYGTCISINNCNSLLDLVLTQGSNPRVRSFLRSSVCGYTGNTPIVCCQSQNNVEISTLPPTNQNTNNKRTPLPKSPDCGFSNITNPKIVNGIPAKLGEFPWMVALGYRNSKNPEMPKWLCGGSLITDKHILTAAHCVYNRQDLYLARLGDLDLFSDDDGAKPVNIPLAQAKVHENYDPKNYINDIAILTLKNAHNNPTVWPICLPIVEPFRSMDYVNFSPVVAGWGSLYFRGPSSSSLQEIFLPVLKNDACERVFRNQAIIDERILCAGYLQGGKDTCKGDSGGPLMHEINEGNSYRAYQIGVVSYGFKCAEAGYPGVYTRVTHFVDWIQKNIFD